MADGVTLPSIPADPSEDILFKDDLTGIHPFLQQTSGQKFKDDVAYVISTLLLISLAELRGSTHNCKFS
jgi:hypothetical protein